MGGSAFGWIFNISAGGMAVGSFWGDDLPIGAEGFVYIPTFDDDVTFRLGAVVRHSNGRLHGLQFKDEFGEFDNATLFPGLSAKYS